MTAKTHILGGVLAAELICLAGRSSAISVPLLLAGAATGALLPDIDHRGSKVSRSSAAGKVTSFAVSALTTHRGVVHTPAFVLLCGVALGAVSFFANGLIGPALLLGLIVGMLSHLALDTLNPSGIMWLWPLSKKRLHLASIRTNSLFEWLTASVLLVADCYLASSFLPELLYEIKKLI